MVRKLQIEVVDDTPRPIVAVGNDYPDGHVIPPHRHRRGQLISSITGALVLTTPQGTWVMPPQRGMWISPDTAHDVRLIGAASLQSLYVEPAEFHADVPARDGAQFCGLGSAGLPCRRAAAACGGRDRHHRCHGARPRQPGRLHHHVQAPTWGFAAELSTTGTRFQRSRSVA